MMRFIRVLALLSILAPGPAFLVEAQVDTKIAALQDSEPDILQTSAIIFNADLNAYQLQARNSASAVLVNNPTDAQIRNYYALACIYYATNGIPNPRTTELIPGAIIPKWSTETNWINTAQYCTWYGVTCNGSGDVVGIDLHENSIFGIFPNEVVLLKTSLQLLELYNNAFLYSVAPKWLSGMGELKYLFFGSTAFAHDGIPTDLSGATNLSKCSNHQFQNFNFNFNFNFNWTAVTSNSFHRLSNFCDILQTSPHEKQLNLIVPIPSGGTVQSVPMHLMVLITWSTSIWETTLTPTRVRLVVQLLSASSPCS
jgi:hypothetical protein